MMIETMPVIDAHDNYAMVITQGAAEDRQSSPPGDFDSSSFEMRPAVLLEVNGCYMTGNAGSDTDSMTIASCDPADTIDDRQVMLPYTPRKISSYPQAGHAGGLQGMLRIIVVVTVLSMLGISYPQSGPKRNGRTGRRT